MFSLTELFLCGPNFSSAVCLETWPLKYLARYLLTKSSFPPMPTLLSELYIDRITHRIIFYIILMFVESSCCCEWQPFIFSHCCIIAYSTAYGHLGCFHFGSIKIILIGRFMDIYFVPFWFGINPGFLGHKVIYAYY